MYKLLFFLHKSDDDTLHQHFKDITVTLLGNIIGDEVNLARVENNLLLDQKYSHFCEISAPSQFEMNKLMNSKAGKELNKDIMDFHSNITVITINYDKEN